MKIVHLHVVLKTPEERQAYEKNMEARRQLERDLEEIRRERDQHLAERWQIPYSDDRPPSAWRRLYGFRVITSDSLPPDTMAIVSIQV